MRITTATAAFTCTPPAAPFHYFPRMRSLSQSKAALSSLFLSRSFTLVLCFGGICMGVPLAAGIYECLCVRRVLLKATNAFFYSNPREIEETGEMLCCAA